MFRTQIALTQLYNHPKNEPTAGPTILEAVCEVMLSRAEVGEPGPAREAEPGAGYA